MTITISVNDLTQLQSGAQCALLHGARGADTVTDTDGNGHFVTKLDAERVPLHALTSFGALRLVVGDTLTIERYDHNAFTDSHAATVTALELVRYDAITDADAQALGYADRADFRRDKGIEIDFMRGFLIWLA